LGEAPHYHYYVICKRVKEWARTNTRGENNASNYHHHSRIAEKENDVETEQQTFKLRRWIIKQQWHPSSCHQQPPPRVFCARAEIKPYLGSSVTLASEAHLGMFWVT
jgi:hypothetical protein